MGSMDLIADVAMLILIDQRQAYGLWHIQTCGFVVGDFNASMCPLKITDRAAYDRDEWEETTPPFARRKGCRSMTAQESGEYHRSLACWPECSKVQHDARDGLTRHILRACTARCVATAAVLERIATEMNISLSTLRKIAARRHDRGMYAEGTRGFPVPSQRRVEARRREKRA